MGIGSSYAEVEEAYKKDIDPGGNRQDPDHCRFCIWRDHLFNFKNDKAERVFLGAEAE